MLLFCHAERHLCLTGKIVKLKGMENMYEKLFSRGRIGNLELKSRIVMPPMGTSMAAMNGEASDRIIRYYEERAKAGCGLICTRYGSNAFTMRSVSPISTRSKQIDLRVK